MSLPWIRCTAALLWVVLAMSPASAEDAPLARAQALREAASKDWQKQEHTAAAAKLEEALAIYDRIEGESVLDRAITIRALVWNQVRANDPAAARLVLPRLMALAAKDEGARRELDSAWIAIWEAASALPALTEGAGLLLALRAEAADLGLERTVGQASHDLGSLARKHGDTKSAAAYYEEAVRTRREIGDAVGEAWSLNNLANMRLVGDDLEGALEPLGAAYRLVHEAAVVPPQSAIAWNMRKAIELMKAAPEAGHVAWLRAAAAAAREHRQAAWVSAEHLERTALHLAGALGEDAKTRKLATSIAGLSPKSRVPEIAADLRIRAALAAADAGDGRRATRWLTSLDVGQGPCRPHLEARRLTALAVCGAAKQKDRAFADAARRAAAAWRDLGDFAGRRAALERLVTAAERAGKTEAIADVIDEADQARRAGGPGGDGAAAVSGGDRSRARDVPLHGVAFHLACKDGAVHIVDKIGKHGTQREIRWKPGRMAINGLTLTFFGGYVVIESMNYGGGAATTAPPATATLDDLGVYHPLPAEGVLVVLKNGAVRYATAPTTGK